MSGTERPGHHRETRQLLATLEAVRDAANALGEMAKSLRDALANGGLPIRPPRWAYFLRKYAWQLVGGASLLVLGALAKQYGEAAAIFIAMVLSWI